MDETISVDGRLVHVLYVKRPFPSPTIDFPSERFEVGCSENMLYSKHGVPMVEHLNPDYTIHSYVFTDIRLLSYQTFCNITPSLPTYHMTRP